MTTHNPDPVREENGQWYFSDETWSHDYGPYPTEAECRTELTAYVRWLTFGEDRETNLQRAAAKVLQMAKHHDECVIDLDGRVLGCVCGLWMLRAALNEELK